MRDINKHLKKEEKPLINPRDVLLKEYYKFLDVFLKELTNKLPPYRPYDHKIKLLTDLKDYMKNTSLYLILTEELIMVKKYLKKNLNKGFIAGSSASIVSPILFVHKSGGGLQFYIDYRKLNAIMKKDKYPIPLIEEIMAQLMKIR